METHLKIRVSRACGFSAATALQHGGHHYCGKLLGGGGAFRRGNDGEFYLWVG